MQSPLDHVLVWDLETIPDLPCVARVNGFDEADEAVAREKLGDKFPKLIYHAIVCIGALIAERVEGVWIVRSLGAPNIADRTEAELIQSFVDRIAAWDRTDRPLVSSAVQAFVSLDLNTSMATQITPKSSYRGSLPEWVCSPAGLTSPGVRRRPTPLM